MKKWIENISETNHSNTVWLFRRAVYLLVLFYFGRLIPYANEFFGPDTFIHYNHFDGNITKWIVQLLNFALFENAYPIFLWLLFGFLALGILGKWPTISAIGIYLCAIVLQYKMINIANGGEQLLFNILFWMIFLNESKATTKEKRLISWFGLAAIKFEVVLLYFTAGFSKLTGEHWLAGDAFYLVSQIPEYSSPWMANLAISMPLVGYFLNYYTLIYQVGFPFMIWLKPIKYKWMTLGVFFHIGIGFVCGIMDFGLILIASYLVFYDEGRSLAIRSLLPNIKKAGYKTIKANGD